MSSSVDLYQPDLLRMGLCHYCGQSRPICWHVVDSEATIVKNIVKKIVCHCCKTCCNNTALIVERFPGSFYFRDQGVSIEERLQVLTERIRQDRAKIASIQSGHRVYGTPVDNIHLLGAAPSPGPWERAEQIRGRVQSINAQVQRIRESLRHQKDSYRLLLSVIPYML